MRTKAFLLAGAMALLATTSGPAAQAGPSTMDLLKAGDVLASRTWHPAASRTGHSYHLDPADSTYHVSFAPADREVGEALREALGALVEVTYDAEPSGPGIQTGGDRFNDLPPFTGGAFVLPVGSTTARQCTSGFAITDGFGVRGSVTAGHCAGNNTNLNYTTGSGVFYGQTQGSVQNSTQDMARLHGFFTVTYEPVIYTNPGAPTTRRVVGKGDPTVGNTVCISGSITGAKCNVRITSPNTGTVFDPVSGVTTTGLMVGTRTDVTIVQPGDSGGPVYSQSGADGAIIRGMIVGRNGKHTVYLHPVSKVESGLGVTVAVA